MYCTDNFKEEKQMLSRNLKWDYIDEYINLVQNLSFRTVQAKPLKEKILLNIST